MSDNTTTSSLPVGTSTSNAISTTSRIRPATNANDDHDYHILNK